MKRALMTIIVAVVVASTGSLPAQAANQQLGITLRTDHATVTAGQPVVVAITMKNLSSHDIDCATYYRGNLDRNFEYSVLYEGKPALMRRGIPQTFDTFPCVLKPGQTSEPTGGVLTSLYDFSRPGEYTVQVMRSISAVGKQIAKSNIVTITILPASTSPKS